jgi:hypothetical protein
VGKCLAACGKEVKVKKIIILLLILGLMILTLEAGTFYIVKDGKKIEAGTFNSPKEFVKIMKKQVATEEQLKEEEKGIHGLMFFIIPAPKDSIERVVEKRILDFYNYPEKFGFTKDETTGLYSTKDELLKSEELKKKSEKYGHYKIFIIGIDVKYDRMHSISKSNGVRIFLDAWYK